MITVDNLSVEFSGHTLFDEITFLVNQKDKIALVGKNGAGKTTMLRIFAGLQKPVRGNVLMPRDIKIGYLPQHAIYKDGHTVLQETEKAFEHIFEQQLLIDRLSLELAERNDHHSHDYLKLIDRLAHETEKLAMMGAADYVADVEKTLFGLGFVRSDFARQTNEFSGGWRMRIELAKILLQRPDVLLLDEPTNHLDIESIQWLENFLTTSNAAVLLVSHDRAFINAVTNRTIEISLGQIYDYRVNYDKYVVLRRERREQQLRAYENQQKMIADTEDFIERFRYKATKAVQVQSRIKQLEKIERIEVDLEDTGRLNLKFPPAPRSGTIPVEIDRLTKAYGDKVILENVDLIINRGEKIAFVGKNGEGKTTLVKCIMDEVAYSGVMKLGHNVKIGYFAQNQASLLDEERTVFETVDYAAVGDVRTKIRDILGAFMFGGEASDKKVKVLSGGERSRLAMIRLLLEPVNLLILDEPTNHLDMQSKDVLKNALKAFNGTVIVVSHDREFLDGLVDKVYEFSNKKMREHIGGIYEFLEKKVHLSPVSSKREGENRRKLSNLTDSSSMVSPLSLEEGLGARSYEARKEQAKLLRKAERAVTNVETQITELETAITDIENQMHDVEKIADGALFSLYEKKKRELEQKMYEWELLSDEMNNLQ